MKRLPPLALIALLTALIALIATLLARDWLWSLEAAHSLQALGDGLRLPMRIITFLGDEQFYLAAIPLVYWCIHKELGVDLGVLLVLSSAVNGLLKSFIKHDRPYWEEPALQLSDATSFSTPSGHAQTSAALFGRLAAFLGGSGLRVVWAVFFGLLIALVALSRVYLGVHFPGDVLWGIAIGLALASLYGWAKPRLLPRTRRLSLGMHALLALVCGGAILGVEYGLLLIPFGAGQGFSALYPEAWATTLEEAATVAGLAIGLWIGLAVESRHVGFSVAGPGWQRVLRYLIGVAVLLGIWLGLRAVFPQQPLPLGLGLRVVRYGLAMAWGIVGWPWLFVRIGLGRREARPRDAGPVDQPKPPQPAAAI